MEIDITSLLEMDAFELSHSRMEGGDNAGRNTWEASKRAARENVLLDTPEKLDAMRDFARSSGGWDDEEVQAWDSQEVNALFLQWIAGDVRQHPRRLDGVRFFRLSSGNVYVREDGETFGPYASHGEAYEAHKPEPGHQFSTAEDLSMIDWRQVEEMRDRIPGNLSRAEDGRIYFHLGI